MKIKEINISNFRGISEITINNIENALVLIGKNNSGKSAVLTAIRTFWGNYVPEVKDFHKDSEEITIQINFEITDEYFELMFFNDKVGFSKVPSTNTDYNNSKNNTEWAEISFSDFKNFRTQNLSSDELTIKNKYYNIWLNSIKNKLQLLDGNEITVKCCFSKNNFSKAQYYIGEDIIKDFSAFLPDLAFIDDSRNFNEEETGKSKSLTSNIIKIIQSGVTTNNNYIKCDNCSFTDCEERCMHELVGKSAEELSTDELEKLINIKLHQQSQVVTSSISEHFQENYRKDYKINLKVTSDTSKSINVATKIYDPVLENEIELSNVGAGIRSIYLLSLLQSFQGMKSNSAIFLIEEPELYLHPSLQRKMAKILSLISNHSQILFTTHSPILLNEFCSSEIRKVSMDEDLYQSQISETSISDILDEIGYTTQDILHTDFVIFVEGQTDKEILNKIIGKYYNIDENKITIVDTKSCNNIAFFATLRFLNKTSLNDSYFIFRDLDTSLKEKILETLENQLVTNSITINFENLTNQIFITKYSSIEGYLFSPSLLVSKGIFESEQSLFDSLRDYLNCTKDNQIKNFRKHNPNNETRVSTFISEYDDKITSIEDNIEWVKTNIRGHNYFNFSRSSQIDFQTYVDELPSTAFQDIITFLNTKEYFNSRFTDN